MAKSRPYGEQWKYNKLVCSLIGWKETSQDCTVIKIIRTCVKLMDGQGGSEKSQELFWYTYVLSDKSLDMGCLSLVGF